MTRDQIDELMRENGIVIVGEAVYVLCNLVEQQSAAEERETCAKVCDDEAKENGNSEEWVYHTATGLAAAIRARGQ